jgi:hypothetical protein
MRHEGYCKSSRTSGGPDMACGVQDLKAAMPIVAREAGRSKVDFSHLLWLQPPPLHIPDRSIDSVQCIFIYRQ